MRDENLSDFIVEKVKKLLSLANSSNENESAVASQKALELLTRYNLSLKEVERHNTSYINGNIVKSGVELNYLHSILLKYFNVKTVLKDGNKKTIVFLGKKHNVEIGEFVYVFLSRAMMSGYKQYLTALGKKVSKTPIGFRRSYYLGFARALEVKLNKTRTKVYTENSLVPTFDEHLEQFANDFCNGRYARGYNINHINGDAYWSGQNDGKKTNLSIGLKSNDSAYYNDKKYIGNRE